MSNDSNLCRRCYVDYTPSETTAIVFVILFILPTILHFYQLIATRTWYLIPLVIGGCFEWIGYIGRIIGANEAPNYTLGPYILQVLLLLLAPTLFAASIYMGLGRVILLVNGNSLSPIRQKILTKIFVAGDVLSFVVQAAGGGQMTSKNPSAKTRGENIVLAGIFLQIVFFGLFIAVAFVFHLRLRRTPSPRSAEVPWRKHLFALYFASALIMVRSVYRVIEYIQGQDGYLMTHEAFLYAFDAFLMLLVLFTFNIIHPSEVKGYLRGGKVSTNIVMLRKLNRPTDSSWTGSEFTGAH